MCKGIGIFFNGRHHINIEAGGEGLQVPLLVTGDGVRNLKYKKINSRVNKSRQPGHNHIFDNHDL